jgi:hypothetical protein
VRRRIAKIQAGDFFEDFAKLLFGGWHFPTIFSMSDLGATPSVVCLFWSVAVADRVF